MAEQPPWRAIQPPKLPHFTGEVDGCDADEFIQEAERILRNFKMEDGTAVEWLIQALEGSAQKGGAHPRSRGGRHSSPSFGSLCSNLWRSLGPLCSAHLVPRPAAGNGGECSGVRAAPAYADHQAECSAGRCCQPRYALRPFYRFYRSLRCDICCYTMEHDDVIFHQARAEAQRWMREDADVEVQAEQVLVAQPLSLIHI